jgi:hypothetical protein
MAKPDFAAHTPSDKEPRIITESNESITDADDQLYLESIEEMMDEWESGADDLAYDVLEMEVDDDV